MPRPRQRQLRGATIIPRRIRALTRRAARSAVYTRMTKNGYNLLSALCIVGSVIVALAGAGNADDMLAVGLVGLAGTIAGRGTKA